MANAESNEPTQIMLDNEHYRIMLLSGDATILRSLERFFVGTKLTVASVAREDEVMPLLNSEKFDVIISEVCTNAQESFCLRQRIREGGYGMPLLFLVPQHCWSNMELLCQIVEDPYSYYIPENADGRFLSAKLKQVINASRSKEMLNYTRSKLERNLMLASHLQQAMLPPWVFFNKSYEFSSFYCPFSQVSGDLFEWIPLDDDRALFIFGDVSGHGTHSALAMTAVQSFLKQIIFLDKEKAQKPYLVAREINEFFCHHLQNIVYMSTLIAYFDFKNNYLCYQNAGYMDLVCVDAITGQIDNINPQKKGSLPLGMVKDAQYTEDENVEYHFLDSSVFLFFSDGLMDLAKDKAGESFMDMDVCMNLVSRLVMEAQKEEKTIAIPFRCHHSLEELGYQCPQDDLSMVIIRKPLNLEKEYVFSSHVPADKKAVDAICEKASGFVSSYYGDEELSVNTELLLEEYLINVIMHGLNEYEKLHEYIAIKLCAYDDKLKLIIWDHGKEWNGLVMQSQTADETLDRLNEELMTSGRGLPIIGKIASFSSRQRYSGLNESIFFIPRKERKDGE